jgi:hypothetical protein
MYEELRMRAQTSEIPTSGDFAADHADGQDDDVEKRILGCGSGTSFTPSSFPRALRSIE